MKEYNFDKAGNGKITVTLYDDHLELKRSGLISKVLKGKEDDSLYYQDIKEMMWVGPSFLTIGKLTLLGQKKILVFHFAKKELEKALEVKQFIEKKRLESKETGVDSSIANGG